MDNPKPAPHCLYCDRQDVPLRRIHEGYWRTPPDDVCEECFCWNCGAEWGPADTAPCWDEMPETPK